MEYSSPVPVKQPDPPPPITAACYICFEPSTIDQPLRRNCACRGDAGWAHVACLAEFAATKVTEILLAQRETDSLVMASLWDKCSLCKTPHMHYLGVAMADAFVQQYKHLPDTNELRFSSLFSLAKSRFDVDDYDGAMELLVGLQHMLASLTSMGVDVCIRELHLHDMMGYVFINNNQFKDALSTFERQRELLVATYGSNSPEVESNNEMLVMLKERIGQKRNTAAELVRARERFRENHECVNIVYKLRVHMMLVDALRNDGKSQESIEQFEKLLVESRHCLGPDHPETLRYENHAAKYQQIPFETPMASNSSAAGATISKKTGVWAVIDCEQQPAISGQRVNVLRATKDARKYICLIKNDKKGVSTKFKVTQNQFILEPGTTVVVHGLVSSADLNSSIGIIRSFDKEKRRYAVSVGKKKTAVSIKPINLNVVFS